ncbi:unnamed protein product [Moneuplotes crassus]|uniref:Uncharacterized protein n=1 Tax=Euplotes crassus TaxID=5936 RepID=A0AAD1XZQ4_EUPCR|nr:unnamed protein product [Moneuplotes crassus]
MPGKRKVYRKTVTKGSVDHKNQRKRQDTSPSKAQTSRNSAQGRITQARAAPVSAMQKQASNVDSEGWWDTTLKLALFGAAAAGGYYLGSKLNESNQNSDKDTQNYSESASHYLDKHQEESNEEFKEVYEEDFKEEFYEDFAIDDNASNRPPCYRFQDQFRRCINENINDIKKCNDLTESLENCQRDHSNII